MKKVAWRFRAQVIKRNNHGIGQNAPQFYDTVGRWLPKVVESSGTKLTIGASDEKTNVIVSDDQIAGAHCLLRVKDNSVVTVMDLGTDAGTKVRGRVIEEECQLQDGDILHIGGAKVTVNFGGAVLSPTVPGRVPAGLDDMTEEQGDEATEIIHTEENNRDKTLEKTEKTSMTENQNNEPENTSLVTTLPPQKQNVCRDSTALG